jgi:hypothetical protein
MMLRSRVESSNPRSIPSGSRVCRSLAVGTGSLRAGVLGSLRSWLIGFLASVSLGSCSGPLAPSRVESASTAPARVVDEPAERAVAEEPPAYVSRAREVWRSAAQASDWDEVALKIDALPEPERTEPGTRYVRALAARRRGDCPRALSALEGLAEALPLLEAEIDAIRSECQLTVGPFDSLGESTNGVSARGGPHVAAGGSARARPIPGRKPARRSRR